MVAHIHELDVLGIGIKVNDVEKLALLGTQSLQLLLRGIAFLAALLGVLADGATLAPRLGRANHCAFIRPDIVVDVVSAGRPQSADRQIAIHVVRMFFIRNDVTHNGKIVDTLVRLEKFDVLFLGQRRKRQTTAVGILALTSIGPLQDFVSCGGTVLCHCFLHGCFGQVGVFSHLA